MYLEMIVIRRFDFTSFAICLHTIAPSIRPKDANGMWKCSREMRIVSLIDEEDVIERILRHLGLWQEGGCVHSGTDPPGETTLDPWLDDPFPDYDTEPVVAFSAT